MMSEPGMPPAIEPQVAIIQVGFRNPDDIVACFESLARQDYRAFRLCLVENGPAEAFAALCAALEKSGLVQPEPGALPGLWRGTAFEDRRPLEILSAPDNPGYAGAINRALARHPDVDAIWILNPDTTASPGALSALVKHAATGRYGIVGARLVNPETRRVQLYGGRWRKFMARGYNLGLGESEDATPDTVAVEAAMDYVNGASMFVTRDFLRTIGPMPEDYFLYCEEVDWCLSRGSFRLGYAHDALIHHAHGSTIGSSTSRRDRSRLSVYLDERNRLLLTRRRYPAIFPLAALICLVLILQYPRHRAFRNALHALAGWFAGIRNETGKPEWFRR